MHLEDAAHELERLVERVTGGDWTYEDLVATGKKGSKHSQPSRLLDQAEDLLIGDERDLAYRYVRAACAAMEIIDLEHGEELPE